MMGDCRKYDPVFFCPVQLSHQSVTVVQSFRSSEVNNFMTTLATSSSFLPRMASCHKKPIGFPHLCDTPLRGAIVW